MRAQFDSKKNVLQSIVQELCIKEIKNASSHDLFFANFKEFVRKIKTIQIDGTLSTLMRKLQKYEERLIGISLTGEREHCYIKECLAMCLTAIIELALFCYAQAKNFLGTCATLASDETKKIYMNLNQIIFHHYQAALGKTAAQFLKNNLEQQILHSTLR